MRDLNICSKTFSKEDITMVIMVTMDALHLLTIKDLAREDIIGITRLNFQVCPLCLEDNLNNIKLLFKKIPL
jgi:hypothetical protein